jgi:hypothetical protein
VDDGGCERWRRERAGAKDEGGHPRRRTRRGVEDEDERGVGWTRCEVWKRLCER